MLNDRIQAANRIRPSETSTLRHIAMRKGVRLSARGSQRQGSYAWGECAEPVGKNGWADGRKFRLKKHGRKSVGALGGVKIVPPPAPSRDDVREVTHRWMRQRKMVMGGEWFTAAIERSQWAEASKRGNQPQGMTREVLPAIESILASYARSRKTFKAHLGEEDFIVTFHSAQRPQRRRPIQGIAAHPELRRDRQREEPAHHHADDRPRAGPVPVSSECVNTSAS